MATPVPPFNHPCWHRLATGGLAKLNTQHLGTQLMSKRIERSPAPANEKASEIYAFFTRWERALQYEVAQLTRL